MAIVIIHRIPTKFVTDLLFSPSEYIEGKIFSIEGFERLVTYRRVNFARNGNG